MDRLLSVADVAEPLGLSQFTVYAWAAKRRLPVIKVGSRLMFFRSADLERWVDLQASPVAPTLGRDDEPEGGARV